MTSDSDRAARYLARIPGSGEGGRNDALNKAAYAVREHFPGVGESEFSALLEDWASRSLSPSLPADEVAKTIRSAWVGAETRGTVGSKANAPRSSYPPRTGSLQRPLQPVPHHQPSPASTPPAAYDYDTVDRLPDAVPDGAAALLKAVFRPEEGVRIAQGRIDDETGRDTPKDEGMVLPSKDWVQMFEAKGGPGAIWSSSKGAGVFVTINPMKPGGAKDQDVTAFRHALVEIDHNLTPIQQWGLWIASELPCAAIISSGGKSVHAWVKVDAKDRREYDERVAILHAHFAAYGIDSKNKNPSRFSRLPDVKRGKGRQELLAINVGVASWSEWIKRLEGDSIGKSKGIGELLALDTDHDPNCVIGFDAEGKSLRFLCKGKSAWLLGPSGIGKSSLITEFAVGWALGRPVFGIRPPRPLKSLIVQAENDDCDLAEMVKTLAASIRDAHPDDPFAGEAEVAAIGDLVRFRTETRSVGAAFVDRLHRFLDADRPDIVWVDPLLSFAGIDVSKQDQVSPFLRTLINPVLEATGAVLIGIHHTGKPKSTKDTAGWTAIDWAYAGIGSSELVNWARAVMLLRPTGEREFQLMLAKRGKRAGATHPDGEPTTVIHLRHAARGIRWEQVEAPVESEEGGDSGQGSPMRPKGSQKGGKAGRPAMGDSIWTRAGDFADWHPEIPPEGWSQTALIEALQSWLSTRGISVSDSTLRRDTIGRLTDATSRVPKLVLNAGKYHVPNRP